MKLEIRRATMSDLSQIEKIENSLEHRILSYDIIASTLQKDNYYYYVAISDDKTVGYFASELLVDHFDILAIAVLKEYRGNHIASSLLNYFINISLSLDIRDIFLEVREKNHPAISFYEKHGFEKISSRKNYYVDTNEDAYIYKKMV